MHASRISSVAPVSSLVYPLGAGYLTPRSLKQWGEALLLAGIYIALARLGQLLAIEPGNVTPVWFPSGVIFAALLLRGFYLWPGVFLGAFIGNAWAYVSHDYSETLIRALCSATLNGAGDVLCALVGAYVMRQRLMSEEPFLSVANCVYFVLFAVFGGAVISAVFGVGGLVAFGFLPLESVSSTWLTWFIGDAVGILVLGSLLLIWFIPFDPVLHIATPGVKEYLAFIVAGSALLFVTMLFIFREAAFTTGLPLMFLLPMLAWSALRLGLRWTFLVSNIIAFFSLLVFLHYHVEPGNSEMTAGLIVLQSFIAVLLMTVLLFSAVTYQWADTYQKMLNAKQIAEESSRFKSNFLSSVSHELRTPMNGVIGYIDLLHGTDLTAAQAGYINGVDKSAKHMMTLIDELLDLARAESGNVGQHESNYSPVSLLDETSELFEHLLHQTDIGLRVQVDKDLPEWLVGDTKRIKQILVNFVSNAFKFTVQGDIVLRVEMPSALVVRYSVRDSGIGVSEQEKEQIFEPFSHINNGEIYRGGTGLGLHICSRIVNSMGGAIGLESETGEGSSFWFELPLKEGIAAQDEQKNAGHQKFSALGLHILVAEDNPVNIKVVTALLERFGCKVVAARDGKQAVERAQGQHFDVILMDCMMPVMDGFNAARAIRDNAGLNCRTPIIALTANALSENRDKCFESGMNEFMTKPISAKKLYVAVSRFSASDPLAELSQ